MLEVTPKRTPARVLRRMQPKAAGQIRQAIVAIAADPAGHGLDVRPLTNRPGQRLRIGGWRVIFEIDDGILDVLAIEPRGDVYKPRKRR